MNEEFVKRLYSTLIEDGLATYEKIYNRPIDERAITYWKNAKQLYASLDTREKEIFFLIIKQVMEDTTASFLAILDGSYGLKGEELECEVKINGEPTGDDLSEEFLRFIDEMEDSKEKN